MKSARLEKKVTIYDIAERAGTSPSTVGSVLNGSWRNRRISAARAEIIKGVAEKMGYAPNMQASALRNDRSRMIGMILPMYENRYFSAIAEIFERESRSRGLLPMTSCTRRDPSLELSTVRQMLAYQVDRIVCTGATDPDEIARLCQRYGVPTINLDLPGSVAPSIISNNYSGAYKLTAELIHRAEKKGTPWRDDLLFVGGRPHDHNTSERVRGFRDALLAANVEPIEANILTCGYATVKAERALEAHVGKIGRVPTAIFVNSTISLEGVIRWLGHHHRQALDTIIFGCFDWDPFAQFVAKNLLSVRQDAPAMLNAMFEIIDNDLDPGASLIEIEPTVIIEDGTAGPEAAD
ncbi:MAG: LacI family DNA-binding transcriptional regulator [Pseudomonadota bacterium]